MQKTIDLYKTIVSELKRLTALGNPPIDPIAPGGFPMMIHAGSKRTLHINTKINTAIASISRSIRDNRTEINEHFSQADWNKIVRREIGELLTRLDFDDDDSENAKKLKKLLNDRVNLHTTKEMISDEFIFPTTWLAGAPHHFEFGPAKLETRQNWLKRQYDANRISTITKRRLKKIWQGDKVHPRRSTLDARCEEAISDTIGNHEYLISVSVCGFSNDFSQDRAARIARLLLVIISLTWQTPSKTLRGLKLSYDDLPSKSVLLQVIEPHGFSVSYDRITHPFGPHIDNDTWEGIAQNYSSIFQQAKLIANLIATNRCPPERQKVLKKMDVALRWFYEGCRAQDALLATTHFASALETLADGKGDAGILKVLHKRVGWGKNMKMHIDGHSLEIIIRRIYGDARSRFLHGNTESHLSDWSELRGLAEHICRYALICCMEDADRDSNLQDFRL